MVVKDTCTKKDAGSFHIKKTLALNPKDEVFLHNRFLF